MNNVLIFLLTVLVLALTLPASAQSNMPAKTNCKEQQVSINGYFIAAYKKADIKARMKARKKRLENRDFDAPIDSDEQVFFIPKTQEKELVSRLQCLNQGATEIFLPCRSAYVTIFNEHFCNDDVDCQPAKLFSNAFYKVKGARSYVFQIVEIQGNWTGVSVDRKSIGNLFYKQLKNTGAGDSVRISFLSNANEINQNPTFNTRSIRFWKDVPSVWAN